MREILFRGKRIDNSEWIEGYYSYAHNGYNLEKHFIQDKTTGIRIEVNPETISQYTNMKDKNGKRIFEGDIVRATIERGEGCQSPRTENGVIGYDCIGMIGLILYKDKNGENVWSDFFNELSLSGTIDDYYFEVIGNVYDKL